jgi:Holliday junction resolvase-like predicted endonuclease
MPLKIRPIEIGERDELEPMIVANPDVVEEGLKVISRQLQTDTGPLDILGVDSEGKLVIIELKNEPSESHLDQGLRYYDWCRQNLAWMASAYRDHRIDAKSTPRLLLIAPSFTENVKRISKYVNVDLGLFEYHAVEDDKGERGLICTGLDFGQPVDPPDIPTIDEKLRYFTDEEVRDLFKSVLSELQAAKLEVRPVGGLNVTVWCKGKRFAWMAPRKRFFVIDVLSPGGTWTGLQSIKDRKAWEEVRDSRVKPYVEYLTTAQ